MKKEEHIRTLLKRINILKLPKQKNTLGPAVGVVNGRRTLDTNAAESQSRSDWDFETSATSGVSLVQSEKNGESYVQRTTLLM